MTNLEYLSEAYRRMYCEVTPHIACQVTGEPFTDGKELAVRMDFRAKGESKTIHMNIDDMRKLRDWINLIDSPIEPLK